MNVCKNISKIFRRLDNGETVKLVNPFVLGKYRISKLTKYELDESYPNFNKDYENLIYCSCGSVGQWDTKEGIKEYIMGMPLDAYMLV